MCVLSGRGIMEVAALAHVLSHSCIPLEIQDDDEGRLDRVPRAVILSMAKCQRLVAGASPGRARRTRYLARSQVSVAEPARPGRPASSHGCPSLL